MTIDNNRLGDASIAANAAFAEPAFLGSKDFVSALSHIDLGSSDPGDSLWRMVLPASISTVSLFDAVSGVKLGSVRATRPGIVLDGEDVAFVLIGHPDLRGRIWISTVLRHQVEEGILKLTVSFD